MPAVLTGRAARGKAMEWKIFNWRIECFDGCGKKAGLVDFLEVSPQVYDIVHTEVSEAMRGRGLAGQLVDKAAEEIKDRGVHLVKTCSCSYAAQHLEKDG